MYVVHYDFHPKSTVWKGGEKWSNFLVEKPKMSTSAWQPMSALTVISLIDNNENGTLLL